MAFLDLFRRRPRRAPRERLPTFVEAQLQRRAYEAAQRTRLNSDWQDSRYDANREIHWGLATVRSRCRDAERNHGLFDAMLDMHVDQIVGRGYQLQALPRNPGGQVDAVASDIIERRWREWARQPVSLDGQLNLRDFVKLAVRSWVRDGEFFVRPLVRDGQLRLQGLEGDYCPELLDDTSRAAPGAVRLINGISVDADGRPIAYHFALEHPGAVGYGRAAVPDTLSVPASEVLHLYSHKRAGQLRGMPLGVTSLNELGMLKGYQDAELVAARMNAARPASIERTLDSTGEWLGDGGGTTAVPGAAAEGDGSNQPPPITVDGSAGGVTVLPPGYTLKWGSVEHPSGAMGEFVSIITRHLAASWNVSHALLTRNLREVNYSSLRIESVACARYFGARQDELVARLLEPIYQLWLEVELLAGRLQSPAGAFTLPFSRIDKYREVRFIPPPFPSYDPEKDLAAEREKVRMGIKSLSSVCLEMTGRELADVVAERAEERALLQAAGLVDIQEQEQPVQPAQVQMTEEDREAVATALRRSLQ